MDLSTSEKPSMTPQTLESVQSCARAGRLLEALALVDGLPKPRSQTKRRDQEILRAELWQITGRNEQARDLVKALLKNDLANAQKARCQVLLGQVSLEREGPSHSIRYFQRAIRLASEVHEMKLVCHAQAKLLTTLAEISTRAPIVALMREADRNIAIFGDAQLAADFHTRAAQIEATAGSFSRAVKHLTTAETLNQTDPNLWLEGSTSLAASAIYFLSSDLVMAEEYARRALTRAVRSRANRNGCYSKSGPATTTSG